MKHSGNCSPGGASGAGCWHCRRLAHAEDDVRLRLNWMYYGSHAGFALGKDKGYYKDARHQSRHPLRQRLGLGAPPGRQWRQHLLLRLLRLDDQSRRAGRAADLGRRDRRRWAPRRSSCARMPGVKAIEDLKGKTLLTTANAGVNTFFPLVLKNAGLTEADVQHHQRAGRRAGLELPAGRRRRGRHPRRPRRQAGRDQGQWRRAAGHLPLFRLRREPGRLLHRRHQGHGRRTTPTW